MASSASFEPMAQAVLTTAVPGALASDLSKVPYLNLKEGVRLGPSGPPYRSQNQEPS